MNSRGPDFTAAAEVASVDPAAVLEQLDRILKSGTFAAAQRSRDLVALVVYETVAGRGDRLNERVVAREALGRPPTLDTRVDASGRVQAGRARSLLERYYATEGLDDPVIISIPLGQYVATFARRSADLPGAVPGAFSGTTGPMLAVLNFSHDSSPQGRRVSFGLPEAVVDALSGFPGLRVAGPINVPRRRLTELDLLGVAHRTSAAYIVHGSARDVEGTLRVTARLVDSTSMQVRWSATYDRTPDELEPFGAEDDIAGRIAAVIGDFNGVVLRDTRRAAQQDGHPQVVDALRGYFSFLADLGPDGAEEMMAALEEAHRLEPANATVLGCLASAHAVAVLMSGADGAAESLAVAERLGREVLTLDPTSAPAHNVLAIVMLARGRLAEADQHARTALQLTPFHPGNLYGAGMVIGACGDWPGGIAVIRRAVQLNPYGPSHHRTLLSVDALLRDDVAEALSEASLVRFPGYLYGPLLRMICLSELGFAADAAREHAEVVALVPTFFDAPTQVLAVAPTLPRHVIEHLVQRIMRCQPNPPR